MIKISTKKETEFSFEEVIKHYSDTYIGECPIEIEEGDCEICNLYHKILDKYNLLGNTKRWDYDD